MSDKYSAVSPTGSTERPKRVGDRPAADNVQQQGKQLADDARVRAEELTNEQMKIGAEHVKRIASAVGAAADELNDSSPLLAHYARSMSSAFSGMSEKMRNESPGNVLKNASNYASREPMAFFGAAVVAGFALSRFLKSSGETATASFNTGGSRAGDRTATAGISMPAGSQEKQHER